MNIHIYRIMEYKKTLKSAARTSANRHQFLSLWYENACCHGRIQESESVEGAALGPHSLVSRVGGVLHDSGETCIPLLSHTSFISGATLTLGHVRERALFEGEDVRCVPEGRRGSAAGVCVDASARCVLTFCVCSSEEPGGGGQARRPQHHPEERDRLSAEPHQRSTDHHRAPFAQSPAHASVCAR